jgi:hypothetical protein
MRLLVLASPLRAVFHLALALAVLAIAPPAAATEPSRPESRPASNYAARGVLGPVRLGPVLGIGFPDGLTLGVHAKLAGWAAVGLQGGWVPETKLPVAEDTRVVRVSGEAFARVHPFRAGFFLGCGIGAAQMKGSLFTEQKTFGQTVDARARAFVRTVYLSPQLGYQWMFGRAVSASIDVGVQIPIAPGDPTFDASALGLVQPFEATGKLADAMRLAVRSPVPTVNLLRLGVQL